MRSKVINKFNRGEIDSQALSREDVQRVRDTCSSMVNFLPLRLGPMQYRPGMKYLGAAIGGATRLVSFVASDSDYAMLEFGNTNLGFWVSDLRVAQVSATTSLLNQTFDVDIANWTDASGSGSTTSAASGTLNLQGADTTSAVSYQTTTSTDTGNEHLLSITVERGPVILQLGTSGNSSSNITETTLLPGVHHIYFTPAAAFTVTFSNSNKYSVRVQQVLLSTSTSDLTIAHGLTQAELVNIRHTQIGDVVFCTWSGTADKAHTPFRIERRGVKSWSKANIWVEDGPFEPINDTDITITAGALDGDTTLTASRNFFTIEHIGALFKLSSSGQKVTASVTAQANGTNGILVTGVSNGRSFIVTLTGTWVATVTLQRSSDNTTWTDTDTSWTANVDATYNDTLDNSLFYYRLYVKTGDFTSGTVAMTLDYASGSIDGICKVHTHSSSTSVSVSVLSDFGSTDATKDWYEGSWSDERGHPTAVAAYEGRLWYAGRDKLWGSSSDAYSVFDDTITGDSQPIMRTIGFGPVDNINWLAPSTRLLMGTASAEISVRSSTFGEPLTVDNTNLKAASTQGSKNLEPALLDDLIYYVQRSGVKIYEAVYQSDRDVHIAKDLTVLNKAVCSAGVERVIVSRQPETRLWVVLSDGTAVTYLVEETEDVRAWSRITTSSSGQGIRDICVLPGADEDQVYFAVQRAGGAYIEKLAKLTEVEGASTSRHFDSHLVYTSPGTTITIAHLDTETVGVWADGQDRGTFTVASNTITVPTAWTNVVVGLPYTADYVSNKISGYIESSSLNKRKRIVDMGLVMENYVPGALTVGPSIALLEVLPSIENGTDVDTTTTFSSYDYLPFEFNGEEESDPRIFMRATGPCTILSLMYDVMHSGEPEE